MLGEKKKKKFSLKRAETGRMIPDISAFGRQALNRRLSPFGKTRPPRRWDGGAPGALPRSIQQRRGQATLSPRLFPLLFPCPEPPMFNRRTTAAKRTKSCSHVATIRSAQENHCRHSLLHTAGRYVNPQGSCCTICYPDISMYGTVPTVCLR